MVFLTAVLFSALTYGVWSAIVAALLSFLAYNFFFIAPVNTLTIAEPHELFALMIFLIVAVFTGGLAGRVRDQAEATRLRVRTIESLYEFSRKLSGTAKLDDVLWAASSHIHETVGGAVALLMPRDGDLALVMAWPPEDTLGTSEMTAARWAFEKGEPAGAGTGTLPNIRLQFRPLLTPRTTVGVCGMALPPPGDVRAAETERALSAILNQTATAIDRALLVVETARADALEQSEKLRTALLSSISHDLRTPLATITGAVSSLRTFGPELGEASRSDLLQSIDEEAARLSRFVSNLLDMTRIEAGALDAMRDWIDIADTIRAAVERARDAFPGQAIAVSLAPDLPLVRGDSTLLGQVLFNLLDNAQKYGASSAGTVVFARKDGDWLVISVTDQGRGIAEADLERVFDKFHRVAPADGRALGTGLGLSICRGLVEAMGGTIHAESPAARRRGTRIVIRLPLAAEAVAMEAIP
jgi:two-component system sensor histidine kinase KdpD